MLFALFVSVHRFGFSNRMIAWLSSYLRVIVVTSGAPQGGYWIAFTYFICESPSGVYSIFPCVNVCKLGYTFPLFQLNTWMVLNLFSLILRTCVHGVQSMVWCWTQKNVRRYLLRGVIRFPLITVLPITSWKMSAIAKTCELFSTHNSSFR